MVFIQLGGIMVTQNAIAQAFQALKIVGESSSTTGKQQVLSEYIHNEVLQTLLQLAYNPFLQYNIKKLPKAQKVKKNFQVSVTTYSAFLNLLAQLNKREITGNAALDAVERFFEEDCNEDEFLWYSRVLKKDLCIGIADKGINKVFKGLIPTYEVLLADKIPPEGLNLDTAKVIKMLPERMVTQYKIDGYRLNVFVYKKTVEVRTRNGKYVTGYSDLEKEALEKLPSGFVYDGEMVAPELYEWIESNMNSDSASTPNRDLFSEAMSHAFSKEDNKQGVFNIFDMIPIPEWNSKKTTETLEHRTQKILEQIAPLELNHFRIVPTSRVYLKENPEDLSEIVDTFHKYLDWGWEGLMIKNWDSVYEFKRSKNLLKMKLMDTIDLEVIEVFEGEGKYTNKLGGVIVDYKGFKLGVGSGWKDDQREYYWKNKNEILGKTIEIAYQAETSNKEGGLSLSFPVVKAIRQDK